MFSNLIKQFEMKTVMNLSLNPILTQERTYQQKSNDKI